MYYYISGELVLADPVNAVIDAQGVGYRINISGNTLGNVHVDDVLNITTTVNLGSLPPDAVDVEAYLGSVDAHNEIICSQSVTMKMLEDRGNGNYLYGCEVTCSHSGRFGITARIKAAGTEWDNSVPGFMCWPK